MIIRWPFHQSNHFDRLVQIISPTSSVSCARLRCQCEPLINLPCHILRPFVYELSPAHPPWGGKRKPDLQLRQCIGIRSLTTFCTSPAAAPEPRGSCRHHRCSFTGKQEGNASSTAGSNTRFPFFFASVYAATAAVAFSTPPCNRPSISQWHKAPPGNDGSRI